MPAPVAPEVSVVAGDSVAALAVVVAMAPALVVAVAVLEVVMDEADTAEEVDLDMEAEDLVTEGAVLLARMEVRRPRLHLRNPIRSPTSPPPEAKKARPSTFAT